MLPWAAESLQHELAPLLPGIEVQVRAQCGSTNSELVERAREAGAAFTPCLLVAEQQTAGRGRLGRGWVAAPGASLTFSLALPLAPTDWSGLSLAVGVALADALEPLPACALPSGGAAAARIGLKWPNDLWLLDDEGGVAGDARRIDGGRKLGGILVETMNAGAARVAVVGVGLNVQPLPGAAVQALGRRIACVQEIDPLAEAPTVLHRVGLPLVRALRAFEQQGFAPLVQAYARRDVLRGREVTATGAGTLDGVVEGVDAEGALVLRAGSRRERIVSGEVSVRVA